MGAPSTFEVDGQQHLALLVGSPALPSEGPGAAASTTLASSNNSCLLVYSIDGTAELPHTPVETDTDLGNL